MSRTTPEHDVPRTPLRRAGRAVAWVLLGFVVLAGAGLAYLESSGGQELIRRHVEQALNERVTGHASIGELHFALFGKLELGRLALADANGQPVVELDSLVVEPAWRDLLRGRIAIDDVTLKGLRLHVVEDKNGGSNLARLFKPAPAARPGAAKKPGRRVEVRHIGVSGVQVALEKPDGEEIHLKHVALDAALDAVPGQETATLSVDHLGAALDLQSPDGVHVALDKLATTLHVALVKGAGTVTLGKVSAHARLERPGAKAFETDLSLGGVKLHVAPGRLGATLHRLAVGLALLNTLEIHGGYHQQALAGAQNAVLAGLHVDGRKLNRLLGEDLVATNVDASAKLAGQPSALALGVDVQTDGGSVALNGTVNASKLDAPSYDLDLLVHDVATRKLLKSRDAPEVDVRKLDVRVDGSGIQPDQLSDRVRLELGKTRIGNVRISDARLRGRIEHGVMIIDELVVHALGQTVRASGRLRLADKNLDLTVAFDGDVGRALRALRAAGLPVQSNVPPGAITFTHDELKLSLRGKLDQGLTLALPNAKLHVAGGTVTLDGHVALAPRGTDAEGHPKLGVDRLDTRVRLSGISLAKLAAFSGKRLEGMDGRVNGTLHVSGTQRQPHLDVALDVSAARTDRAVAPSIRTEIRGKTHGNELSLSVGVYRARPGKSRDRLASLDARVPLSTAGKPHLAPGRELSVKLDVPRRTLGELKELLPPQVRKRIQLPPDTEIEGHADLTGTADAPHGAFHVLAQRPVAGTGGQRLALDGELDGNQARAELNGWLDQNQKPVAHLTARATFPSSPLAGGARGNVQWSLGGAVGPVDLRGLGQPDLSGQALAELDLSGTRHNAAGRLTLKASDVRRGELGPFDANADVTLTPDTTRMDLGASAAGLEALRGTATLGVGGRGLLDRVRQKRLGDPTLEATLEVPRRPLSQWSKLDPKLAALLGALGAKLRVRGTVKQPLVDGQIALDDFRLVDGQPGAARIGFNADRSEVRARVTLGPAAGPPALAFRAHAARGPLLALLTRKHGDARAQVAFNARAENQPLTHVVPVLAPALTKFGTRGRLDWNMHGVLRLASHDGVRRVGDASLGGRLDLTRGMIPIPGTNRRYRDVALSLAAEPNGLEIQRLELHESDREKSDRRLMLHGELAWDRLRPKRVDLTVDAKDFLVFGGDFGRPDAPRAALTAKLDLVGDLDRPRKRVDVTVQSLNLSMPDRFDKAHWPEVTSLGDVIDLDKTSVHVGQLEAPPPAEAQEAAAPDTHTAPSAAAAGTDIYVHIPHRIHAQKPPFDLYATGNLKVAVRPGRATAVRGQIDVLDGHMALGGRNYPVMQGKLSRIFFDAKHPHGALDLWVHYVPNPVVLQDVSLASAGGDDLRLHLTGPLSKVDAKVTGVGNADLWDMLPVTNVGHVKHVSQPDMPSTETAQLPRKYDIILISYMTVNAPRMAFWDRESAWADPYDDRFAYGRIRHYEGERYSSNGKERIRVTERPSEIGASRVEAEGDYLLLNQPKLKAGAGLVAGSRLGGGPALFFEWSSDN